MLLIVLQLCAQRSGFPVASRQGDFRLALTKMSKRPPSKRNGCPEAAELQGLNIKHPKYAAKVQNVLS